MYQRRFMDLDSAELKSPVAIIGLPGIANVGTIAVTTLARVLDAKKVMEFFSDDFPARVFVKEGLTRFPKSSLFYYKAAPDEPHDILILSADFQPASGAGVFEYSDFIVKEFVNLRVKEVFALAAYEQDYEKFFGSYPAQPRVFISASSPDLLDRVSSLEDTVATKDGVVNGANGFIPAWAASMYDLEGACLLGETLGMIKLDYRAAKTVLEKVSNLVGLKSSYEILDDDVSKVLDFIEWAKGEMIKEGSQSVGEKSPFDRYIG